MSKRFATVILIVTVGAFGQPWTLASESGGVQEAHVRVSQVTKVCDRLLTPGDYVVIHDEAKMERGEPCTTIYRVTSGRPEPIVAFHCVPARRDQATNFTFLTRPYGRRLGGVTVVQLIEYQFAGDREAHGVPATD